MKVLVITVAGKSSRFNQEAEIPVLKCLYKPFPEEPTILQRIIEQYEQYDKFVLVGGYLFQTLQQYVEKDLEAAQEKIDLVFNPRYEEKGTMYSLYLGLKEAEKYDVNELVFTEGDIIADSESVEKLQKQNKDVVTINREPIWADRAVVAYLDEMQHVRYFYDTEHKSLMFNGKIKAVFNSGQVWKFMDPKRLFFLNSQLTEEEQSQTNLVLIQKYFEKLEPEDLEILQFSEWCNCNTREDYVRGIKK